MLADLGVEEGNDTLAVYSGLVSPFSLVDGVQAGLLGASSAVATSDPVLIATA